MARIRSIKPELPQSESMGRVSREARLCFILLWTLADDAGRLRGNARMLASLLYPYDDDAKKHIDKWLVDLHEQGCITRYTIGGDQYIQINAWLTHQKIDKPSPSKIAPPPEDSRSLAKDREGSTADQGVEGRGGEGNGDSAEPQADSTPPFILLPLVDGTEYGVVQGQVDEWAGAYPGVNVPQQLREMRQWCIANPANRKTGRGIVAFVARWLGKEQDKSGVIRPTFGKPEPTATVPLNPAAVYVAPPPLSDAERARAGAALKALQAKVRMQ